MKPVIIYDPWYYGLEDLMVIRSPDANLERLMAKSGVVHEATHAIFDMRCSAPELSDEEAVAYLAQFIWIREAQSRADAGSASGDLGPVSEENERIINAAFAVVDHHNLTRRRPTLNRNDLDDLRAAVAEHPHYRGNVGLSYHRNGIPRVGTARPEEAALRVRNRIHMNRAFRPHRR